MINMKHKKKVYSVRVSVYPSSISIYRQGISDIPERSSQANKKYQWDYSENCLCMH